MRSPDEIIARIAEVEVAGEDWMGTERGDLVTALGYADAEPYLVPSTDPEQWTPVSPETLRTTAVDYLAFAKGKVINHRGLSAARSVSHYRAWLWLLNLLPEDWDATPYPQYGARKLVLAAAALEIDIPFESEEERDMFMRMAEGVECRPNCHEGCGL